MEQPWSCGDSPWGWVLLSPAVQGAGLFSGVLWLTGHPGTGCMPLSWGVLGLMMENLADNPNCSYSQTAHFAGRSDLEVILACTEMCVNEACSHSDQELSRNPGLKQAWMTKSQTQRITYLQNWRSIKLWLYSYHQLHAGTVSSLEVVSNSPSSAPTK